MARFTRERPGPRRRSSGPWQNGAIPVIGVIGGIGAGKSLAAAAFARLGGFLLDADKIGHVLLEQSPSRDRILERFGEEILEPFGDFGVRRDIDRRALGAIVFSKPEALRDLEAILHPAMRRTFEKAIGREARKAVVPAVILDAAILYEAGWDMLCDVVVFVDASPEVRLVRLEAARGWTLEGLQAREKVQGPLEEKRRQANHVLINDGTPEELDAAVSALWKELVGRRARRRGADRAEGASSSSGSPPA